MRVLNERRSRHQPFTLDADTTLVPNGRYVISLFVSIATTFAMSIAAWTDVT
jgi:hypothetical protein